MGDILEVFQGCVISYFEVAWCSDGLVALNVLCCLYSANRDVFSYWANQIQIGASRCSESWDRSRTQTV